MPKPVVSSTFFSFPKLLVWSLPLLGIISYTYLAGVQTTLKTLVAFVTTAENDLNSTLPMLHDTSFTPNFILRVTEAPYTLSCMTKKNVILVNGTSPGPEIRLTEGDIYWIRVFNDMDNNNLTMVLIAFLLSVHILSDTLLTIYSIGTD